MAQVLKDHVRERIVEAATEVFAARGFGGAAMSAIAEAAGISTGNVYRYFPTKEDVVLADFIDSRAVQRVLDAPAELSPLQALRFALTSEAGLNDGLAFPFVYAAIAMAGVAGIGWAGEWALKDVLIKGVIGVGGGLLIGKALGKLFFRARKEVFRLAKHSEGFLALAATFLAYGLVEVAGGYGFLAVFIAARAIRSAERSHDFHQVLHDFAEQTERLLTVMLLLLFGGAVVSGLLTPLTWPAALVGLALIFVIRPLTGFLSLRGAPGRTAEHWVIASFGIRGIGSFYYLSYAMTHAEFDRIDLLWATVSFVVLVSVVIHGVAVTPIMRLLDQSNERTRTVSETR